MSIANDKPDVKALLLCGGYSRHMEQDKCMIRYYGKPQWQYLYELLSTHIKDVYISCRSEQMSNFPSHINCITDSLDGTGPGIGMLSAYLYSRRTAWLVLGCNMPLVSEKSILYLINNRNPEKKATPLVSPEDNLPEPMMAIWEPEGLDLLFTHYKEGRNSPGTTLLRTNIAILDNPYPEEQFKANTPEELEEIMSQLEGMC